MNYDKLIDTLNELLTRSHDANKGYIEAGNQVSDVLLRKWLFSNAERRKEFILQLEQEIKRMGGTPDHGSGILGSLHRTWIDIKSTLTNDDDAIIEECIRGEERAIEDYNEAILKFRAGDVTRQVLQRQRASIKAALDSLRAIERSVV
jgi:uncharacterized protein (TIGR02284 family)